MYKPKNQTKTPTHNAVVTFINVHVLIGLLKNLKSKINELIN